MPELPEVQSVVDSIASRLTGALILSTDLRRPDILSLGRFRRSPSTHPLDLPPLLAGRRITSITRRAKRIVFTLDDQSAFYIHLGMTGALSLNPPTTPPHTHLLLRLSPPTPIAPPPETTPHQPHPPNHSPPPPAFKSQIPSPKSQIPPNLGHHIPSIPPTPAPASLLFSDPRRFGKLVYLPAPTAGSIPPDSDLGPEPLTLPPARLHRLLSATRRPIKSALLDQRLIAGLGNIYVDESLFAARLHPLRPACSISLPEARALSSAIKRILNRAIAAKGSTLRDYRDANGDTGNFQSSHRVYNRTNLPCPHCQTPISRLVLSGRSTHLCPACQEVPSEKSTKSEIRRKSK